MTIKNKVIIYSNLKSFKHMFLNKEARHKGYVENVMKEKIFSVDSISGGIARLVSDKGCSTYINYYVYPHIKRGDIVKFKGNKMIADQKETIRRKANNLKLQSQVFKNE